MAMLKSAVLWRKRFGIDELLGVDLGLPELEKVVFYHGADREGHPVCYNVWRIQLLERNIREQLDFSPNGICSMVQVTDLKNSPPMLGKHHGVTCQSLALLQDNYPEFVAKKVFINVPWWYLAANKVMSPFLTQRTKSKIVFCSPDRSAETLFRNRRGPRQRGLHGGVAVWKLRVLGWEVSYGAEFAPDAEGRYTVIVEKMRKVPAHEEPIMKGSFKAAGPDKVVLAVDNRASKKKKLLLYRFRVKSTATEPAA
uniref:CRAL-TRIO domain-containing protein n=1 Tax=Zea mays TaxID=4577 RepID=A0A804MLP5_MAIZE